MRYTNGSLLPLLASITGLASLLAAVFLHSQGEWRQLCLVIIGFAIGAVLLSTNFGFAGAFRKAIEHHSLTTFRAHAVMLALGLVLIVPMLAYSNVSGHGLFGRELYGFETAIGPSFMVGAFLFGTGMQMAGGCASGTLYFLGSGNLKYVFTLIFFIIGCTIGAAHMDFWGSLTALEPVTLFSLGGSLWPLLLVIEVVALVASALFMPFSKKPSRRLITGAVCLALLNALTVVVAGNPWSETIGFALWGSKLAAQIGFSPYQWGFWGDGTALDASIFKNAASIMDLAIILGALCAAALRGEFQLTWGGSWQAWLAAAIGGLLMGYGSRLANGCNIGAYFSAIVSGSLSGYLWAAIAMLGSMAGIGARRLTEALMSATQTRTSAITAKTSGI